MCSCLAPENEQRFARIFVACCIMMSAWRTNEVLGLPCTAYPGESDPGDGAVPNGDPTFVMTKEHAAAFKKVLCPHAIIICLKGLPVSTR